MKHTIGLRTTHARFSVALDAAAIVSIAVGVTLGTLRDNSPLPAAACSLPAPGMDHLQNMEPRARFALDSTSSRGISSGTIATAVTSTEAILPVDLQRYEPTSWTLR